MIRWPGSYWRAACFVPGEPIPRALLLKSLDLDLDEDRAVRRWAGRGLNRLVEVGLLERETEGILVLHRLMAAFVRQVAPDPDARAAVEAALLAEVRRLNKEGYPGRLLVWQPHLRAVTDIAQQRGDERGADLCDVLGYHLHEIGEYEAARPYYERVLAISEKVLGPEHPNTRTVRGNLETLDEK